jgi:hypothetical protein
MVRNSHRAFAGVEMLNSEENAASGKHARVVEKEALVTAAAD